jgi:catechol 2,3-dioxygenase-like lactoylglutathione lyase family enzyme
MNSCFRGVHHLALNTDDMQMTIDFYSGVLGMPLIHAMRVPPGVGVGPGNRGNPPYENLRHYFFDMGHDSTLAFFEIPKGAEAKGDRNTIASMQHVALATDAAGGAELLERLARAGIENSGAIESFPNLFSVYFYDPNGIRLEFAWQAAPIDGNAITVLESVKQSRHEALAELRTLTTDEAWLERATAYWTKDPATSRP